MEQVLAYACTLCLPVKPKSACTVMEVVAADDDIDGSVHLDTADFGTGKILLVVDDGCGCLQ